VLRRPGGGRRAAEDLDPDLVPALLALVEPGERGDPMSPLRWTTKSLRNLAGELTRQGYPVSAPTVGRLLRGQGFSLQANTKTLEGKQHPDRDAQFRHSRSSEPNVKTRLQVRDFEINLCCSAMPNLGALSQRVAASRSRWFRRPPRRARAVGSATFCQ
jgi:hypothetical protein